MKVTLPPHGLPSDCLGQALGEPDVKIDYHIRSAANESSSLSCVTALLTWTNFMVDFKCL